MVKQKKFFFKLAAYSLNTGFGQSKIPFAMRENQLVLPESFQVLCKISVWLKDRDVPDSKVVWSVMVEFIVWRQIHIFSIDVKRSEAFRKCVGF